ncbi:MAG: S49 family peptidase [Desulfobacterales bacterium]|nr:S49 family peptidase [Desulfobacterales bacterium]
MTPAVGLLEKVNGTITESHSSPTWMPSSNSRMTGASRPSWSGWTARAGNVGPSQEIYSALLRLKKTKPVVASMGAVGASGAYYIACAADTVYALPGTMTRQHRGDHGILRCGDGMKRLGIRPRTYRPEPEGRGLPFKPMTPNERIYFKALVDDVHEQFIEAVAKNRKIKPEVVRTLEAEVVPVEG